MKYLIFLDIDGTIMSSEGKIHNRTVSAIKEARRRGHMVFINTGRSLDIIPKFLIEAVEPDGIVAGLGANIIVGKKTLVSETISEELMLFAMHIADKYDNTLIIEGENHSASYHGLCYLGKDLEISEPSELYKRFPDIRVSKMTYVKRLSDKACAELEKCFSVFNHPTYAEVGLPGYSKASGMEFLRKRYGVDISHVIAIGDSDNDREMLGAAGIAVVMGNALDEIKAIADFVTLDCCEGGVGYAIEKLILEKDGE